MAISTRCPHCDTRFNIKDDFAGQRVSCRECGERFRVPDEDDDYDDRPRRRRKAAKKPEENKTLKIVGGIIGGVIGFAAAAGGIGALIDEKKDQAPPPPRVQVAIPEPPQIPKFDHQVRLPEAPVPNRPNPVVPPFPPGQPAEQPEAAQPQSLFTLSNPRKDPGIAGRPTYSVDIQSADDRTPFGPSQFFLVFEQGGRKGELRLSPIDLRKDSISFSQFGGFGGPGGGSGSMTMHVEKEDLRGFPRGQNRTRVSNVVTLD